MPTTGAPSCRQPDQRAPGREAENEGAGAVDRVENPAIRTVPRDVVEFLALYAVLRIFAANHAAHDLLGGAIRFGDRVESLLRLVADSAGSSEMWENHRSRVVGQLMGEDHKIGIDIFIRDHRKRRRLCRFSNSAQKIGKNCSNSCRLI